MAVLYYRVVDIAQVECAGEKLKADQAQVACFCTVEPVITDFGFDAQPTGIHSSRRPKVQRFRHTIMEPFAFCIECLKFPGQAVTIIFPAALLSLSPSPLIEILSTSEILGIFERIAAGLVTCHGPCPG